MGALFQPSFGEGGAFLVPALNNFQTRNFQTRNPDAHAAKPHLQSSKPAPEILHRTSV
jgi:hypothetical protein